MTLAGLKFYVAKDESELLIFLPLTFELLGLQIHGTLPSLCGAGDQIGTRCTQGKHITLLSYFPALFEVLSNDPAK